ELNEETFIGIFKAITNFQLSLSNRCHRGYEDTIARIIRDQLEVIFYKMIKKQHPTVDENTLKITSVMLGWGMYGASVEWRRNPDSVSPEEMIALAVPYLKYGINLKKEKISTE
ncbi:hypothetical protein NXY55_28045, partial [Aeromonas veronii]|nr:hypothetical protein [Aeromonas veronii]